MQQNNGLKFSHDRKNYIDFRSDVLGGGGWGYFENVQWTLCVKESICVQPLSRPRNISSAIFDVMKYHNFSLISIFSKKVNIILSFILIFAIVNRYWFTNSLAAEKNNLTSTH